MSLQCLIKAGRIRLFVHFVCFWVQHRSGCCRHRDHGPQVKLYRVGFGPVQCLVVMLQVHLHVCRGRVGGGGCEDACKASDLVFIVMFPFGFVRGDLLFAVCSVQQLGELGRYAPGVGEYQWREFLVVSPDFFGVGAVVFLVFSVFNRVQVWFVVQSGTLLLCSCQYDFILVLCWFCESVGPKLVAKSGAVDPGGVEEFVVSVLNLNVCVGAYFFL